MRRYNMFPGGKLEFGFGISLVFVRFFDFEIDLCNLYTINFHGYSARNGLARS